jgi:hypothetical protein
MSTCHIAPSFIPPFLLFWGLCLWRLWSASPSYTMARFSRWLLSNCSYCSLLKAVCPEWFPDKVWAGPGVPPSSFFFSKGCALDVSSFISEKAEPSPISGHSLSRTRLKSRLIVSWSPIPEFVQGPHIMSSCFPDIATVSCFGPLFHCCIPGRSAGSSWVPVL